MTTSIERQWMSAITEYGCIVCRTLGFGFVPGAVHHFVDGGRRLGHVFSICLCDPGHHKNAPKESGEISRHPMNKKAFEARYGTEEQLRQRTKKAIGWI